MHLVSDEYHSEWGWQRIEGYLNGRSGLPPERGQWLYRNSEPIRPLIEVSQGRARGPLWRGLAQAVSRSHHGARPLVVEHQSYNRGSVEPQWDFLVK